MPKSEETAQRFMIEGRGGEPPAPWGADSNVSDPQIASVPNFDTQGHTKTVPAGVDYDRKPERKNPRSMSDQAPSKDAQGK